MPDLLQIGTYEFSKTQEKSTPAGAFFVYTCDLQHGTIIYTLSETGGSTMCFVPLPSQFLTTH